jgi:hypothetical protein
MAEALRAPGLSLVFLFVLVLTDQHLDKHYKKFYQNLQALPVCLKLVCIFQDLDKCPTHTMWNFPKKIVIDCNSKIKNISVEELKSYTRELLEYTRKHLTTEKLFNYILNG